MNADSAAVSTAPIATGSGYCSPPSPLSAGNRRSTVVWLAAVTTGCCLLRLWIFNGLHGHDDWMYLLHIRNFLNGHTDDLLGSLWGLRWGIWVPIAVLFKIFGVHYWLAFAPGFLLGLASLPLAYWIAFKISGDIRVARWTTLALIFNPIDWFVSTTIRGDIEMSFFGGLIVLGLVSVEFSRKTNPSRALLLAVATGIAWGFAALTKEWAFVYAWGFLALALWRSVHERRIPWVYAGILLGLVAVMAADGLFLYLTTGVFQQRFQQSFGWFERARLDGGYKSDLSLSYAYLPSLFLNLTNALSLNQRYANGYPFFGWYFYLFIGGLVWGIWRLRGRRSPWSILLCFIIGTMLWMELGSMSMSVYIPYHKEPRYLTILSVPIACWIGWALHSLWLWVQPWLRVVLAILLLSVAANVSRIMWSEHILYTEARDFLPAFISWLKAHPESRLWATGSVQQDIDLRFGYRFADPSHQCRGQPGFGTNQEVIFLDKAKTGDLILITPLCINVLGSHYTPGKWNRIMEFDGPRSHATLYRINR